MAPSSSACHREQPDLSIAKYFANLKDPRRRHRRLHNLHAVAWTSLARHGVAALAALCSVG
jgi:hypothetical protein